MMAKSRGDTGPVKAMLTWVLCSSRPLFVRELRQALKLGFEEYKALIRDFGGTLIEIGDQEQVTAIHYMVKEFFFSDDAGEFQLFGDSAHETLALVCLSYLNGEHNDGGRRTLPEKLNLPKNSRPDLESVRKLDSQQPLLLYASAHIF